MNILLIDCEATALRGGQICQIALLTLSGGERAARNYFFAVDDMSEGAQAVHGMSKAALDALSGGQRFADRADELLEALRHADLLVGHNISSDLRFLREEFSRIGRELPPGTVFYTMNYFTPITQLKRVFHTNRFKPPRLHELAEHYRLTPDRIADTARSLFGGGDAAHDARCDVAALYLILLEAARMGDLEKYAPFLV